MTASTHTALAPSGEQHEIGHGRQRAVVTEIGATLRVYTVDGSPVIDGFGERDMCSAGRGQVLAPWPNRLGDGKYSIDGRHGEAALDEPERGCAIHGLVRWLPWRLVSRAQNVLVLGCTLNPQPGYPWRIELCIEYRLGRAGLVVSTEVTNADQHPAPFGIGFHPYVTVGTPVIDFARFQVPGRRRLVTDARGLPTGETIVTGTEYDFTEPRMIGTTHLDTAFTDLVRGADGMARVEIDDPTCHVGATVWMDERFRYVMVYTADDVDPGSRRRRALAIEPMTCPPDALRSGVDLVRLEPEAKLHCSWGITPRTLPGTGGPGS
ncbi:MAG TPA: aldose 1-epimerase family protein [Acidimicrobiales bacterium]|nr:aldose 1-epimerase family protein [Acidimicrobiales bacterium]